MLLVVTSHAGLQDWVPGSAGVTVFLAISGFIITYLVVRETEATGGFGVGRFYLRRALKLLPPLALIMLVPTLIYAACGGAVSAGVVISQALFSFNWVMAYAPGTIEAMPGSGVLWSLSVEEQFYIVFALYWAFASRRANYLRYAAGFGVAAIVISFLSRVVLAASAIDASDRINYGTDTRMESVGWGVLAAVAYVHWQRGGRPLRRLHRWAVHPAVPVAAIVAFAASLVVRDEWFRETVRYTLQSVCACTIILFGLIAKNRTREVLLRVSRLRAVWLVGLASYSIYLIHQPLYYAIEGAFGVDLNPLLAPLYIGVGVVAGIGVYRILEVPFENIRASLHRRQELPVVQHKGAAPLPASHGFRG